MVFVIVIEILNVMNIVSLVDQIVTEDNDHFDHLDHDVVDHDLVVIENVNDYVVDCCYYLDHYYHLDGSDYFHRIDLNF